MRPLSEDEVKRFSSPYYLHGYREDDICIDGVSVEKNRLIANVQVKRLYFDDLPRALPHFSSLLALQWASYLAVLYGRWEDVEMGRSGTPFVLREGTVKCREIITARSFFAELKILKFRELKHGVFHSVKVEFDGAKFCVLMNSFKKHKR